MNSCLEAFSSAVKVKPIRRVPVWADREFYIKEGVRYDLFRTPYAEEIGNAASYDSPIQQISIVKGQQLGLTELLKAIIGQCMSENPDNIIYILPTISTAIQFSKSKLQKMIDASPALSRLVSDASSRDGTNTNLMKEYPGGTIYIITANSGSEVRMKDARIVLCDEYDEHADDIAGQGSGKDIASGRTAAKGDQAKIILNSTPIEKEKSKIWAEFLEGSQEYYYVPCPYCLHLQVMKWENFKYDQGDINSIRLKCVNMDCEKLIEEKHKGWMMAKENGAKWIAHNPDRQNKLHRSFHISSFYSPIGFLSWKQILQKWFDIKGKESKLIAFRQLVEGIPYERPEEEQTPVGELMDRRYRFKVPISDYIRENYKNIFDENGELYDEKILVPKKCLLLTGGADTQDRWIETYVIGWGLNGEWWLIDHKRIDAPEGRYVDHKIVWDEQEIFRKKTYIHESGVEMRIEAIFHDSAGHYTDVVYDFVRGKYGQRYIATKGSSIAGAPLIGPRSTSNKGKIPMHMIGTDTAKRSIFGRFKAKKPGENGYFHLPDWCTDESCAQFVSEKLFKKRVKNTKGGMETKQYYEKIRDRNEAIDCLVGAYSAMRYCKPNWVALSDIYFSGSDEVIENAVDEPEIDEEVITIDENQKNIGENQDEQRETRPELEGNDKEETVIQKDYIQQRLQERRGTQKPTRRPKNRLGWWANRR